MSVEADVVRRICGSARPSLRCPLPPRPLLNRAVRFVAAKAMHAKGALMTVSLRQLRPQLPRRVHATRCLATWLGLEDCVYLLLRGKLVLYRSCVQQKLGLEGWLSSFSRA